MATYDGNTQDYQELIEKGYDFNLSAYLKRGWELLKENIGGFIGFVFVFFILAFLIGMITQSLSFVSESAVLGFILRQITNLPIVGLTAGFLVVAHKIATKHDHSFGDFFGGLKDMIQLWLANVVASLFALAPLAIAMYIALGDQLGELYNQMQDTAYIMQNSQEFFSTFTEAGPKLAIFGIIGGIAAIVISILYSFSQPLILFGRLKFWDALETSRKIIGGQVLNFFLLNLVLGLSMFAIALPMIIGAATGSAFIMFVGGVVMLVGLLMYMPYIMCVNYSAYEDIVINNVSGSAMDSMIDEIGEE